MTRHILPILLLCLCLGTAEAATKVANMKVLGLSAPLGIDETPTFSWQIESTERGLVQASYQLSVRDAAGSEVWNSGVVDSRKQHSVAYEGPSLSSRSAYTWTVAITATNGETAEGSSTFETGVLAQSEWTGKWIYTDQSAQKTCMAIGLDDAQGQYVKIDITKLGAPCSSESWKYYVQLAEVEIYSGGKNVAIGATVTASDSYEVGSSWSKRFINDGIISSSSPLGFTTHDYNNANQHVTLTFKLKESMSIDKVVLYPRQDERAANDATRAANFPASFTIETSDNNADYTVAYTATDIAAPKLVSEVVPVPYYGKSFEVKKEVKRARLYASALGVFTMKMNGKPVTENRLEPGETGFLKHVIYNTYDVTSLCQQGENALVAQVAGGLFNITKVGANGGLTARYSKGTVSNQGESGLRAELLLEYTDGSRETIVTDDTWRTTASPAASNWWGGEDYDATKETDLTDFSAWNTVCVTDAPQWSSNIESGTVGEMKVRLHEPLRVVERWSAVSVKPITIGGKQAYIIDFGRNYAGQYRFTLKGKKGQAITLRPGERLNSDGTVLVDYWNTPPYDNYDCYTFRGDAEGETWGPEFMYHGSRYLQVLGLTEAPQPEDFTAERIRSAMDEAGTFETSNTLLNSIHTICRDGIQSQLYNSMTDCPHREKLGWLDVVNELYNSICFNYDANNFMRKVMMDCFDAQLADGHVPSTVPFYHDEWSDDPNWGGAALLTPYRVWKRYGDDSLICQYYPKMKALIDYYTSKTSGDIMTSYYKFQGGELSDWGQSSAGLSRLVPAEFTLTTTYYYMLRVMNEVAAYLGYDSDAAGFDAQSQRTKAAFNKRFYDEATGVYEYGNQAEYGMPLYYGLVDEANEQRVADRLAEVVSADGYKIRTGEIGLKPVLMSLADHGHNDVVYRWAKSTSQPSFGYWVMNGATTSCELWNMEFSNNHCMMNHIEEWFFTQLGGIQNTDCAFDEIIIRPWIPADMKRLDVSAGTIHGKVRSAYQRLTDGIRYEFCIPANATARVTVPILSVDNKVQENGRNVRAGENGIIDIIYTDSLATLTLGSGSYTFTVGSGDEVEVSYWDEKTDGTPDEPVADLTEKYLIERTHFTPTAETKGPRFATPLYWTVENYSVPTINSGTRNGLDSYGAIGTDYCLALNRWDSEDKKGAASWSETQRDARVYQRVRLTKGIYYFGAKYNAINLASSSYIFAATDLVSTREMETSPSVLRCGTLDHASKAGDRFYGIYFTLDSEQDIYLGFQSDLYAANTTEVRMTEVCLYTYTDEENSTSIHNIPKQANNSIYNLSGMKVASMSHPGLYIVGGMKISKR